MDALSAVTAQGTNAYQSAMAAQAQSTKKSLRHSEESYEKTARDFEGVFMSQMIQPMFEGLEVDGLFGGGHGEEMFRGLITQEYGKAMAAADTSGLSDAIKDQMIKLQEQANKGSAVA